MLNTTTLVVDAVSHHLVRQYNRVFGHREPDFRIEIDAAVRLALERIAQSDALYHNVEHTVMVTLVGTEILRGRDLVEQVEAEEWLHFTVALLLHDIGYVRGALRADGACSFVINEQGERITPPRGASDAYLTPTMSIAARCSCASAPMPSARSIRSGSRARSSSRAFRFRTTTITRPPATNPAWCAPPT
jgi:hypothetical protein